MANSLKASKIELKNQFFKAQQLSFKFENSEMFSLRLKNLEQKLADQVKLNQGVEVAVEKRLKEAIDQLLGNKPVEQIELLDNKLDTKIDLKNIRFTDIVCPANNQNQVVEFPAKNLRDDLVKQKTQDFWLAKVEYNDYRFNFIANDGKRTEQKNDYPIKIKEYIMPERVKQTRKV